MMYCTDVLLIFLIGILNSATSIKLPYRVPKSCGDNEFFQHSSLECISCGTNQKTGSDLLTCVCENGHKTSLNYGGPKLECSKCGLNEAVASDGWNCIKCANGLDKEKKTCKPCGNKGVAVDRSENGSFYSDKKQTCLACTADTSVLSSHRICRRCHQNVLELTKDSRNGVSCVCPEKIIKKDGSVVETSEADGICFQQKNLINDVANLYTIRYSNFLTIESFFFRQHLRAAQAMCILHQNYTACQLLGNLCVMYMYNEDNYEQSGTSRTDACKEFLLIVSQYTKLFVRNLKDWPSTMPWLYYKVESTVLALDKTDIFHKFQRRQELRFVIVSYFANGTFDAISEDASILQFCPTPQTLTSYAFQFSTPYQSKCQVKLGDFSKKHTTRFFDLYLRIDDQTMYPIPVLVDNIQLLGTNVNQLSDRHYWRLTKRFFLVDNISGKSSENSRPQIIQYAEQLELNIRLREDGLIYPPLLKVKYKAADVSNVLSDNDDVSVSFKMSYEMNIDNIFRDIQIAVGVLSVIGIMYASIRTFSYRKRDGVQVIDCTSIFIFLVYVCCALAIVFFLVLIGVSLQWLFFYKQQATVIRLLPVGAQEGIIKSLFIASFFMMGVYVLFLLYSQIDIDIFFIDWERPRTVNRVMDEEQNRSPQSVSIMRTLFVANEWREVQTTRKINPVLLIIILLFFMKVVGFENWSTTDPLNRLSVDPSKDYIGEINFTLRFGVISLLFVLIAVVLWILFSLIYERFIGDSIGDFIDFCSMSNISIFILTHKQFGYYLHGLSVHGRADTSLHELYEQFQREEENLCGKRGLEPNSELQVFEMAVTRRFREEYDKILNLMINRDAPNMRRDHPVPVARQNKANGSNLPARLESSVNAYHMMNRFLSAFIEHSIRDNNYIVKDKVFSEKLFKNELLTPFENSFFYNDEHRSFTSILMYGQEFTFLVFYLFLFIMVDWLSNWNCILAAVVVYFVDVIFVTARDYFGKRNLANKTMVNERFLI